MHLREMTETLFFAHALQTRIKTALFDEM